MSIVSRYYQIWKYKLIMEEYQASSSFSISIYLGQFPWWLLWYQERIISWKWKLMEQSWTRIFWRGKEKWTKIWISYFYQSYWLYVVRKVPPFNILTKFILFGLLQEYQYLRQVLKMFEFKLFATRHISEIWRGTPVVQTMDGQFVNGGQVFSIRPVCLHVVHWHFQSELLWLRKMT